MALLKKMKTSMMEVSLQMSDMCSANSDLLFNQTNVAFAIQC